MADLVAYIAVTAFRNEETGCKLYEINVGIFPPASYRLWALWQPDKTSLIDNSSHNHNWAAVTNSCLVRLPKGVPRDITWRRNTQLSYYS
ncbi:hypothetical protein CEXT_728821 [Caerostris extrusa]|uniref:Uncharacterized protein n=1 Tax=Caerostris extrusa TaxID=172846 RepID=A0AAV4U8I4_CAEEX|nr:hypothetical protein CEXT_728821 [Caerostris extrusa]